MQVDDEDFYDVPDESEHDSEDSNGNGKWSFRVSPRYKIFVLNFNCFLWFSDENNPNFDYPDEESEDEEEESDSEASDNESKDESVSDRSLESKDLEEYAISGDDLSFDHEDDRDDGEDWM